MRVRTIILAAVAALALAACGADTEPTPDADGNGPAAGNGGEAALADELVLGGSLAPATYEAKNMNWGNQSIFAQAVYDSLLKAAPNGVDVEPSLATDWSYNEDETVLTLTLRDDVVFTDGTPFDADAAVQNLLRFRDGESPQRPKFADVVDARAVDDTTVEIELARRNPAFLIYLTQVGGLQASPESFDNPDTETNPVGSGPYILDVGRTVVGTSYVYTRNADYWDPESVRYERLMVNIYGEATSMLNALRGGQLNAAALPDNTIVEQVEGAGFDTHPNFLNLTGLFLWDRGGERNEAIGDVRVRQAINYAFDREQLLEVVGLGYGELDQQVFRPSSPAYDDSLNDRYTYDPDRARELLEEAGYGDGFDLVLPTAPAFGPSLDAIIQQQLGEVGIRVTFEDVGVNLITEILGQNYAASYFNLQQDPQPHQLIDFMLAPNATWNPFGYEDPHATELMETATTADGAEADEALRELNAYIVEEAWFAKWYTLQNSFVTDADTDVTVNEGNVYPYLWDITPAS